MALFLVGLQAYPALPVLVGLSHFFDIIDAVLLCLVDGGERRLPEMHRDVAVSRL